MTLRPSAALLAAALLPSALAAPAAAQTPIAPLSVEARLDAGFPTGDSGLLDTGWGWGVQGNLGLSDRVAVYGGFSRYTFDARRTEVEDDGWSLGVRYGLAPDAPVRPFVQVGLTLHDDTGVEVGLGSVSRIAPTVSLVPLVRWRRSDGAEYLTAGVGARLAI